MNDQKKLSPKAALEAKSDELITELQAIRAQVASKRASTSAPEELADLQQRLFEVWVADKLALASFRYEQATSEQGTTREEVANLRKQLAAVQKEVMRLGKLAEKLTAKLAAKKAAGAGKKR
jgi:chromosome segregation ATPase